MEDKTLLDYVEAVQDAIVPKLAAEHDNFHSVVGAVQDADLRANIIMAAIDWKREAVYVAVETLLDMLRSER